MPTTNVTPAVAKATATETEKIRPNVNTSYKVKDVAPEIKQSELKGELQEEQDIGGSTKEREVKDTVSERAEELNKKTITEKGPTTREAYRRRRSHEQEG